MIIFSRACGYFVFVCAIHILLLGVEWMVLCAWRYAVLSVRVCVRRTFVFSFGIFWGLDTNMKCFVDENDLLFWLGHWVRETYIMQFNCICLSIDRITWLPSISHWIRNCSHAVVLCFVSMEIGFLLALIFITSLHLHSLDYVFFFNF